MSSEVIVPKKVDGGGAGTVAGTDMRSEIARQISELDVTDPSFELKLVALATSGGLPLEPVVRLVLGERK